MKDLALVLALLSPLVAGAAPRDWKVDASHASVNFEIKHFFTPVKGSFTRFDGTFRLDPQDLTNAPKFEFSIDVTSVSTANKDRDSHLQTADFFDAAKWGRIRFVGERVVKTGENTYKAVGKLTIRDVTKDYEVPFTVLGVQEIRMGPPKTVMGLHIETTINRNDFGVGSGNWVATAIVGGSAKVDIFLELN